MSKRSQLGNRHCRSSRIVLMPMLGLVWVCTRSAVRMKVSHIIETRCVSKLSMPMKHGCVQALCGASAQLRTRVRYELQAYRNSAASDFYSEGTPETTIFI